MFTILHMYFNNICSDCASPLLQNKQTKKVSRSESSQYVKYPVAYGGHLKIAKLMACGLGKPSHDRCAKEIHFPTISSNKSSRYTETSGYSCTVKHPLMLCLESRASSLYFCLLLHEVTFGLLYGNVKSTVCLIIG